MSVVISESNRSVFETLSEGQISRILDGSSTEVRVTAQLQSELKAWRIERNLAGESNALGYQVTGNTTGNTAIEAYTERIDELREVDTVKEEDTGKIDQDPEPEVTEKLVIGPLEGLRPSDDQSMTFRYPSDVITSETDYVFFQFGKYVAPFSQDQENLRNSTENRKNRFNDGTTKKTWDKMNTEERRKKQALAQDISQEKALARYNNAGTDYALKPVDDAGAPYESIMLPIPQDLGHEVAQQWQGKQWTTTGRAATAALGAGNFSDAGKAIGDISGWATAMQNSLTEMALNTLPGVGGNITINDLSGATSGIVINPNAELMYDSPEMREIGMVFKMVPRTPQESKIIRRICQSFRKHSMPMFGGADASGTDANSKVTNALYNAGLKGNKEKFNLGGMNNFIRVPNLCKFTFMHGNKVHPYLVQFKPCAISKVEVTYTPDGTFATYKDGAPSAVELRINFMETKVVFADEVELNGASF